MTYVLGAILILYAGGVIALAVNLWQTWQLVRVQRRRTRLAAPREGLPTLDVLVPVKDEAENITSCLESILAQDYPGLRIIVVNDRSTDDTATVVQRLQDRHPQIQRLDITGLPAGLYGKPHALHQAASMLEGEYVAFVDSDLHLDPACLRALVHHAACEQQDWVAVMGSPLIFQFWERLLIPLLGAVTFAWYDPRKVSDPNWDDAVGSGLMVARRAAYEAIGGHRAVIDTYDEDSELVRIAKRAGQHISFLLTPELFTQRHYGTLARTLRGLTRTFMGGIKTVPRMLLTIHALHFVSLLPIGLLALLGVLTWYGVAVPWPAIWLGVAIAHVVVATALAWLVYETADTPRGYALLHPLGSAVLIWVCLRALVGIVRGDAITWRGTTYPA